MHNLIDLRGSITVFIHITDGRFHDNNVLDLLDIVPQLHLTMDKADVDFQVLNRIDDEKAFFVTRTKDNMKYEVIFKNFNINKALGLQENHSIRLTIYKSNKRYVKDCTS